MQAHPELREVICAGQLKVSELTDDERYMCICLLAIMRQHRPQFGNLNITIMAGKVHKFAWTDTLVIK